MLTIVKCFLELFLGAHILLELTNRKPIPERERAIGERLKAVRALLRFTQEEFASAAGIKRQRLASYEEGRAPVRFDIALRICHHFFISEKWLATGRGEARFIVDLLADPASSHVPIDTPFGLAYDLYLGAAYERVRTANGNMPRTVPRPDDNENYYKNYFTMLIGQWFVILPPVERAKLMIDLAFAGDQAVKEWESSGSLPNLGVKAIDYALIKESLSRAGNINLTEPESEMRNKDVKAILPGLLARLRKATEEPGKKSELAKFLDAPLASVSRWLSADPKVQREPGGEIALKMLHWVEVQERKQ